MKKALLAAFLVLSMLLAIVPGTALAASASTGYSDISGQWFTDSVSKYGYAEIFSDGSGKFNPGEKITRIEFVRLLHKALGISINYFAEPDISNAFTDMKNSDTGANELIDLVTTGIVEDGGAFNPDGQLDREVMIHWIMNALNYMTGGTYPMLMIMPAPFKDDDQISDIYISDIYSAVVLKLVYGRGDNMAAPKDGATRAEAVTIVARLADLLSSYNQGVEVTASAWLVKGGALGMSITIRNNTDKEVTLQHTSGQKFDFKLFDANGNNVYTWSADKQFIALVNETVLNPGESITFSDTLDSTAYAALGSAVTMRAYIVGTSEDFAIDGNGYAADIKK